MRLTDARWCSAHARRLGVAIVCGLILSAVPASLVQAASPVTFSYALAANAPVGAGPFATATADLNGDGKADLVVTNANDDTVSILLGKGDGTFVNASGSPFTVGTTPIAVVLTDLNNDGKKDLVTVNRDADTISVLLGNGNGTFTAFGSSVAVGVQPDAIASGDVNGDGKADLVVANATDSTNPGTVSVLLGTGTGAFTTAPGSPLTVGVAPTAVALGNLNPGGVLDLVVTDAQQSDSTIKIFLGAGPARSPPRPFRRSPCRMPPTRSQSAISTGIANWTL